MLDDLKKKKRQWEENTLKKALERYPERKSEFTTISDIPIERLYTPEDSAAIDYLRKHRFSRESGHTLGAYSQQCIMADFGQ